LNWGGHLASKKRPKKTAPKTKVQQHKKKKKTTYTRDHMGGNYLTVLFTAKMGGLFAN